MGHATYIDLLSDEWAQPGVAGMEQFVAVYGDGRALIAHDQAHNPDVRRILSLIEHRLGIDLDRAYVPLDQVASARSAGMAGRRGSADRGMRRAILDLIENAHARRASDIHINIEEKVATVAMRVDGILQNVAQWSAEFGIDFLGATYAMADIANKTFSTARFLGARLAPRTGRDDWAFPAGLEAVRCQYNPKSFGVNYAVFRLLGTIEPGTSLEGLGYEPEQIEALYSFTERSKGLVIFSGPTGSGKSTTMSALLMRQRDLDAQANRVRTLFTVEDPPERRIPGAQQLVVQNTDTDEQRAKAYADALRAALRSDPDVLMVGEIRDGITANLAVGSSMTGHSVLSTLHCSTAHAVPIRLVELGADPSVIYGGDELQVAVAQVLVPKLCLSCRVPIMEAPPSRHHARLIALLGAGAYVRGQGCPNCHHTGINDRTTVAEVVRTDASYLNVLRERGIVAARTFSMARGEPSIADIAIRKARRGEIAADYLPTLIELPTPALEAA